MPCTLTKPFPFTVSNKGLVWDPPTALQWSWWRRVHIFLKYSWSAWQLQVLVFCVLKPSKIMEWQAVKFRINKKSKKSPTGPTERTHYSPSKPIFHTWWNRVFLYLFTLGSVGKVLFKFSWKKGLDGDFHHPNLTDLQFLARKMQKNMTASSIQKVTSSLFLRLLYVHKTDTSKVFPQHSSCWPC